MTTPQTGPARALTPALYGDADIFRLEREAVFARAWRLAGHETMAPAPGDFFTDEIAGASLIVVRGEDGALRGFHNICRHRAGPLATERSGRCAGELVCRYHGWRYALDGRLKNARDFGAAGGFDPRSHGLLPVRIDLWRGFVFATLDEKAAPVADLLAPIAAEWPAAVTAPFALRRSHDIACDWKVYVENYLEGYHVPLVHARLDAEIESAAYRVEMHGETAIHSAPSRRRDAVYAGLWAWAWPWLGINVYRHGVMMERITPIGPRLTRLDYLYFFDPGRRADLDAMLAVSDEVTAEDKAICEAVQNNLESGFYAAGPLSPKHEGAVGWFQDRLRREVGYGA